MKLLLTTLLLTITLSSTAFGDNLNALKALIKKGDYPAVTELLKPLARQSEAWAQHELGYMYDYGKGVPEDKVLAYMWYNLSAANGQEKASKNKGIIAKHMTSSQIAEAQKLSRDCLKNNYKNC